MKKLVGFIFTLLILVSSVSMCFSASANFNSEEITKDLNSYAYYMVSLDDSTEMFSKNENQKVAPAAFCKMIAAIVAVENWKSLDEKVTVTDKSLSLITYDYGVRVAGLKAGDVYTKRQLLDCLVVYSANDVASVIAYEIAGTKDAFIAKMQELVTKIGCKNTKVVDMLGFDADGQYTTAKDVCEIIKYGLNYPAFSEAFCATSVTMPATETQSERTYKTSNRMMTASISDYYHSSVVGGKQTATDEAGECIAVKSTKDGYSYLTVVMKGELKDIDKDEVNENTCMTDAKAMLTWVYNNIKFSVVAAPGQIVGTVDISAAKDTDTLQLTPEKELSVLVPSKVTSNSVLIEPIAETVPKKMKAPVKAGEVICQAKVLYANRELATINLVAASDVNLSLFGLVLTGISAVLKSTVFIALEIIALIVLAVLAIIKINAMKNDSKPNFKLLHGGKSQEAKQTAKKKAPSKNVAQRTNRRPPQQKKRPQSTQRSQPMQKPQKKTKPKKSNAPKK